MDVRLCETRLILLPTKERTPGETERRSTLLESIHLISADDLYHAPLNHPQMLIDGLLSTGLAILSGDSKIGKSWLVLWLGLKIAKGEPVFGIPTRKADVVYLALEDRDWRLQDRLQQLTDDPPSNLHIGFYCSVIGEELEMQIEETLEKYPETALIFIDTFQKVRENVSSKLNAYAKDYQDLSALKRIADEHGICIFLVHHNRKERNEANVFQNITGSTGIAGVADTLMVLQKETHDSKDALLSITGRDIEERILHLRMQDNVWELTEDLDTALLKRKDVPAVIYRIAEYFCDHESFIGSMTDFLKALKDTTAPNAASRYLAKHFDTVLKPLGLHYETHRSTAGRVIGIWRIDDDNDGIDGIDDTGENEKKPSCGKAADAYKARFMTMTAGIDGQLTFPRIPSLSSISSNPSMNQQPDEWMSIDAGDEECPFTTGLS